MDPKAIEILKQRYLENKIIIQPWSESEMNRFQEAVIKLKKVPKKDFYRKITESMGCNRT